ncbi:unnamed protein product (mitochondrion) [Plasmodiophora brassicae]|uniref:Uncharacterized protein n=1 Tax=Plasmodiophora brassicae TaxID=37360 RepID=A0A3P3YEH6_PLABS|nr:unnamed protein product [Plasmodiophora brassicae]
MWSTTTIGCVMFALVLSANARPWAESDENTIKTECPKSLEKCMSAIMSAMKSTIVPEDQYQLFIDELNKALTSIDVGPHVLMRDFTELTNVVKSLETLWTTRQLYWEWSSRRAREWVAYNEDLRKVLQGQVVDVLKEAFSSSSIPNSPPGNNATTSARGNQDAEDVNATAVGLPELTAGQEAQTCLTSELNALHQEPSLANACVNQQTDLSSFEEDDRLLKDQALLKIQLHERNALNLEMCQRELARTKSLLADTRNSSQAAVKKRGKQMLGAGLLVGTAASAVGHVVSHFAKPKAGEIAPVAQPRLFSGAVSTTAVSIAIAGGVALKVVQSATASKTTSKPSPKVGQISPPTATPVSSSPGRTMIIYILAGVCSTLAVVLVFTFVYFKRRLMVN